MSIKLSDKHNHEKELKVEKGSSKKLNKETENLEKKL